jgi:hypothetical protein
MDATPVVLPPLPHEMEVDDMGDGFVHARWTCPRCQTPGSVNGHGREAVLLAARLRAWEHDEMCATKAAEMDAG